MKSSCEHTHVWRCRVPRVKKGNFVFISCFLLVVIVYNFADSVYELVEWLTRSDLSTIRRPSAKLLDLDFSGCSRNQVQYHLFVEGTFFKMNGETLSGIAFVWLKLIKQLSTSKRALSSCPSSPGPQHKVIYIDRSPGDAGSREISSYKITCENGMSRSAIIMVPFRRSLHYTLTTVVPQAIAAAGYGSTTYPVQNVYTSTYYTFPDIRSFPPPGLCTILYVHDTIPEELNFMSPKSQWWPRKVATSFVNSFISVSKSTMRDYIRWYAPYVLRSNLSVNAALQLNDLQLEQETYMTVISNRISFDEFPGPASEAQVTDLKKKFGIFKGDSKGSDLQLKYLYIIGNKNLDFVFRAFDQLPDDLLRKYCILLSIDGYDPRKLGLKHPVQYGKTSLRQAEIDKPAIRVYNPGYIPRELVRVAMTGAYAVIYVSSYEGFGLPIVEAFASGTMVITSNWSSMPEVGGDAAIYINNRTTTDTSELINVLSKVMRFTEAERRQRIELGLKQAARFGGTYGKTENYDAWEDAAVEFVEHLKSDKHKWLECYAAFLNDSCVRHIPN